MLWKSIFNSRLAISPVGALLPEFISIVSLKIKYTICMEIQGTCYTIHIDRNWKHFVRNCSHKVSVHSSKSRRQRARERLLASRSEVIRVGLAVLYTYMVHVFNSAATSLLLFCRVMHSHLSMWLEKSWRRCRTHPGCQPAKDYWHHRTHFWIQ